MNKKNIVIVFGAVIITLLMVSSATAVNLSHIRNIREIRENKVINNEKEVYIDPNIKLTKRYLPKLKMALDKIDKPKYKELTQKIIQTIEKKGIVRSNDLKDILIELNMENTEVYSGKINGYACCLSAAISFPGYLPGIFLFYFGPTVFLFWTAYTSGCENDEIDFTIGVLGHHITEEHSGFALAFFGYHFTYIGGTWPTSPASWVDILGLSPVIFISYD